MELRLRTHGYYDPASGIRVEKQSSDTPRLQKLLENASKRGHGVGKPEFLIHSTKVPEFVVVVECKASSQKHVSSTLNKFQDFAVDGVLLYASYLSKEFDVLAIAVSGEEEKTIRISHFWHLRGASKAIEWQNPAFVPFGDYYDAFLRSDAKFRQDYDGLLDYSRGLNNELQAKKITEADRGFLISGILIGLESRAFKQSFKMQATAKQLAVNLLETISGEFENAGLPQDRRADLAQAFSFISLSPALHDKDFFVGLIDGVDANINAFIRTHKYYDIVGQFYVEFLRYANNDKGLGIVLTPYHVADLFCGLADVNKDSIVFDNCCGTGGLLVAAMRAMVADAGADKQLHKRIKEQQLYGIEFQPKVYALAVSNMVLHDDGKTNIYRGDCFADTVRVLGSCKPTVGFLNPPYKNKTVKEDKEELEFVLNNLDALVQGGKCVVILPITCATAPNGVIADWKRALLQRHTLEAVMSMPVDLFHNSKTTVVTCIMVFTAHRPHPAAKKTWFGYWRDDGFVKTKHRGRIDANGKWNSLKETWVNAYKNREIIDGFSVAKVVTHQDEWCAEAYLETNYSAIDQEAFAGAARKHYVGQILNSSYAGVEAEND